ncbi:MAG: aminotransferase class V-fold PLP-dependent enzyme [Acidilobaceae archaeon]|nr:aminotransferase class V-fold PLP-dependent enzyme [Acidilobaceae archaeon]MCX8165678.1 aminotransferase class V-fold PLP-dependent enzyme [Acidilobaceae archaeon]MDW7974103.1 aminotransferase class V-fold PLP-dependent enzyme [Sulfolobales archaeon]
MRNVRSQIKILEKYVYLDNASSGPLPEPVIGKILEFTRKWQEEGEPWEEGIFSMLNVKRLFADMVGAKREEIAAFPSVTYGLGMILTSLSLRKGKVVLAEHNFPTSVLLARSLEARGLVKEVRVTRLDEVARAIDSETSLVMVDYVGWLSGEVAGLPDIADEAHRHGALLVSDAFHAVGVMPVNVRKLDVDVLVTGSYKWLMSIHGAALAYVREELLDSTIPVFAGWLSVSDSVVRRIEKGEPEFTRPLDTSRLELADGGSRLEPGTLSLLSFAALESSLQFLLENGAPSLYHHTWKLADMIAEEIESAGLELFSPRDNHSAIISFRSDRPMELAGRLERMGVRVAARPGLVRVSPHFYNDSYDVYRFTEALKKALGR